MGTSGFIGFVVDGVEKICQTPGDSYPSGIGEEVLCWLAKNQDALLHPVPGGVSDQIRALRVVNARHEPTLADVDRLRAMLCERAADNSMRAYFAAASAEGVLKSASSDLDIMVHAGLVPGLTLADLARVREAMLRSRGDTDWCNGLTAEELLDLNIEVTALLEAGVTLDRSDFPADSLFCEWGYLIDLDAMTFEVYRGSQKAPHTAGRFARRPPAEEGYHPVALVASWPLADLPDWEAFVAPLRAC
jgi:hypothetical protein